MTASSYAALKERRRRGGIIIPDTAKEKPQEGEVVAVGPGARDESGKLVPVEPKAGDRGCCLENGPAPRSRSTGRMLDPGASIGGFRRGGQFDNPMGERLMEGLRKAGVPEA